MYMYFAVSAFTAMIIVIKHELTNERLLVSEDGRMSMVRRKLSFVPQNSRHVKGKVPARRRRSFLTKAGASISGQ
jgi:hypothetical protein